MKAFVDIDVELLVEATTALGTASQNETVNEALRHVVQAARVKRRRALEGLRRIADEGGIDFDRIAELDE